MADRFGVWLLARQIRRYAVSVAGKRLGDFGCGCHAAFVRPALGELEKAVLVDVALAGDLKTHPRVTGHAARLAGGTAVTGVEVKSRSR